MGLLNKLILAIAIANVSTILAEPVTKVLVRGGEHFEGPHWSSAENALYWIDMHVQRVHRLDYTTGNSSSKDIGYGPVTLVVTVKDNPQLLLISSRAELYFLRWDAPPGDEALRLLSAVDVGLPRNRANDGKVDANGRLWFGTISNEKNDRWDPDLATLYMVDEHNYQNPVPKVRPVSVSNGIAWSADNQYMYYIDTAIRKVDVFEYDLQTANIRNRRTVFDFEAQNITGSPDGMTIDTAGNLWVACYRGGQVLKVDPSTGQILEQHKLPVPGVSSVVFGGPNLDVLFVTTSRYGLTAEQLAAYPDAGSLFAIEGTGAKGFPENQFLFPDAASYITY